MTKLAEVKTLYVSNARQIPEMMRKLAGEVERPPVPGVHVDQALCVIRDSCTGRFNVYGWGDVTIDSSLSLLAQAQQQLVQVARGGDLWTMNTAGMTPPDGTA